MELVRVLLIERPGPGASALLQELSSLGVRGEHADSAAAGLDAMTDGGFTAIVAAEAMPGLPARGLLRAVKRQGLQTPVIVAGRGESVDGVIALFRAGAADYLRLPDHVSDLGEILDRLESEAVAGGPHRPTAAAAGSGVARASEHDASEHDASEHDATEHDAPGGGAGGTHTPRPEAASRSPRNPIARLVEDLRQGKVELPAMAHIARQVQEMMAVLDTPVDDVIEVVGQDPVVSGSLLHLANSAEQRGRTPATDLRTACIRLGNRRVLSLTQEVLLRGHFRFGSGLVREVVEKMWENSVASAFIARRLAEACGLEDLDEVYLTALLHNIGELVLLKLFVELRGRAALDEASLASLADELARHHELVGRLLLASWDTPKRILDVASSHHLVSERLTTPARKLSAICLASWTLACEQGFAYLPGHEMLRSGAHLRRLGLSARAVAGLPAEARQWVDAHIDR